MDDAGLERFAQRVEHDNGELAELVQEQHAPVGEADLAGPQRARPATHERDRQTLPWQSPAWAISYNRRTYSETFNAHIRFTDANLNRGFIQILDRHATALLLAIYLAAHNTIVSLEQPFVSIEYRWENTDALLQNNLTTHGIVERDGAGATLEGNLSDQATDHFVDAAGGDLHLSGGSTAIGAGVDAGVASDFDGEARDAMPDVGADEVL